MAVVNDGTGALTEDEILQVAEAAIRGSGKPLTEEQIMIALEWANQVRVDATLLEMVLSGRIVMDVLTPEPMFRLWESN